MDYFELSDETKVNKYGVTLYRIKALVDIEAKEVKAGDLGGWVEKKGNLKGYGAWIFDEAEVLGNAAVIDNAEMRHSSIAMHHCVISRNAVVKDRARISGFVKVSGGVVGDRAEVSGYAKVHGGELLGNSVLCGEAELYLDTWFCSPFQVKGSCHFICETRQGWLKIGCLEEQPVEELLKNGKFIAKENKYTAGQEAEYFGIVRLYDEILKNRANAITVV